MPGRRGISAYDWRGLPDHVAIWIAGLKRPGSSLRNVFEDDDPGLVARCVVRQDMAAYGELVARHQSQVRNFLRKLTRDHDLADDLAQDSFMHAWDKLHTFTGRGSFISWLLKVAYTRFLQSKRKSTRYGQILQQVKHDAGIVGKRHSTTPDEMSDLDKFLAILTDEERVIMILSYACGLSHREISDTTDLPIGTVKSIIFRGKEKIRGVFHIQDHQYG